MIDAQALSTDRSPTGTRSAAMTSPTSTSVHYYDGVHYDYSASGVPFAETQLLAARAASGSTLWHRPQQIGGDMDEHGCFPSAGYRWCASQCRCVRPWEVRCSSLESVGGERGVHGCLLSAGYMWCESKARCILPWLESCPIPHRWHHPTLVGGERDEHDSLLSAGFTWCDSLRKCIRRWEQSCPPQTESDVYMCPS